MQLLGRTFSEDLHFAYFLYNCESRGAGRSSYSIIVSSPSPIQYIWQNTICRKMNRKYITSIINSLRSISYHSFSYK